MPFKYAREVPALKILVLLVINYIAIILFCFFLFLDYYVRKSSVIRIYMTMSAPCCIFFSRSFKKYMHLFSMLLQTLFLIFLFLLLVQVYIYVGASVCMCLCACVYVCMCVFEMLT